MGKELHSCPDEFGLMALADIGFDVCAGPVRDWQKYLLSDDLWEIQLRAMNPRFLRQIGRLNVHFCVVEWNGDPDTEDAVRLCDLVLLYEHGELVRRFIREKGGRRIFESNIRSYGMCVEYVTPKNDLYPSYMESPLSIIGIGSYQDAFLVGNREWDDNTFQDLGLLGVEYVDQSLLLYWTIPLHFPGMTCCYNRDDESMERDEYIKCLLLDAILDHKAGLNLDHSGYQITPLQLAVYCWNLDLVRYFIHKWRESQWRGY
ncbi:hypothetical protein V8F33_002965 [Rhypophila sp. PSN 637]